MKRTLMQATIVFAIAVGGLSAAQPAAAQPAHETHNFGSHVSQCARVMGGFSSDHNPSTMKQASGAEHSCHVSA